MFYIGYIFQLEFKAMKLTYESPGELVPGVLLMDVVSNYLPDTYIYTHGAALGLAHSAVGDTYAEIPNWSEYCK